MEETSIEGHALDLPFIHLPLSKCLSCSTEGKTLYPGCWVPKGEK